MEPAVQTKSIKPGAVWIRVLALLLSVPAALFLLWRDVHDVLDAVPIMATFSVAAAVCVLLPLGYLFLPSQRGPRPTHLLGAAIGGLTAISVGVPVFDPLIRIQMELTVGTMLALNVNLMS